MGKLRLWIMCVGVIASSGSIAHGANPPAMPDQGPDAAFVYKAGQVDLAQLQLSRLAAARAASPKVREYAQRIIQDHDRSTRELAIIAAHENIALPDVVDTEHAQMLEALAGQDGPVFDDTYLTAMLAAQQRIASLLKSSEAAVSTDELRTYIKRTLPVVENERRLAQDASIQ